MGQDEIHDEKRLVITADFNGQVVSVERPEASVFDFVAGDLVGTSLCDTVDIFTDVSCVQRKMDADCSAMGSLVFAGRSGVCSNVVGLSLM